ncbi:GNAT family N-acetyltransferase [archaeon]|jgi:[ribosomal protein S5]-alanine N-acetyltransferase|nr:GNAT family N-acetyltransferase [archaeon]MBT3578122.1 GNAT family N-acetyltransferase [archaeon]MBT6955685.1 GNAT family N-acetyltransferase [archaeon]MBT7024920.1 GNAT family N-acetyltransferase [archaeon]MBT7238539.1 GNAT family N-acetyltransferase [archaeon]
MELKTKRLILREKKKSDFKSIRENINNINVSRYMSVIPHPYTDKDAIWWIGHSAKKRKEKPRKDYQFGITIKPSDKVVGGIGLVITNEGGVADIGCWIGEEYWRKGYVFEATVRVINYAFDDLKLKKVVLFAAVENVGSNKLIKKLGLKFVKKKKKALVVESTGKVHDTNVYEISRDEWNIK